MAIRHRIDACGYDEPILDVSERFYECILEMLPWDNARSYDQNVAGFEPFHSFNMNEVHVAGYEDFPKHLRRYTHAEIKIALESFCKIAGDPQFNDAFFTKYAGIEKNLFISAFEFALDKLKIIPVDVEFEPHKYG